MYSYLHKIFILAKSGCYNESYVPSQLEAASSYASGSQDMDMEDVDVEFGPQAYTGPVKKWTGDSYQKARTVYAYDN
jgi:hypothetical protein